jgi:hypothetical protein
MNVKQENRISLLKNLPAILDSGKEQYFHSDIPECFHKDLKKFCQGRTVHLSDKGDLIIGRNLYKDWLKKIWNTGLDYDIR